MESHHEEQGLDAEGLCIKRCLTVFETKLLVIAGQSEPNEFICSPITLIDADWWMT
ncbi:hypothetical protein ABVT39_012032, partial [Epinephelus coioides]